MGLAALHSCLLVLVLVSIKFQGSESALASVADPDGWIKGRATFYGKVKCFTFAIRLFPRHQMHANGTNSATMAPELSLAKAVCFYSR